MRYLSVALALALAAAVAGCGESSDNTLSKTEFIKKADAICAKDNKRLQAAGAKIGQKPTSAQMTQFVRSDLVPTLSNQIEKLRALKAPKKDQDHLNKLFDEVDQGLAKVKSEPSLLTQGNPFSRPNAGARAYGLKVCGS